MTNMNQSISHTELLKSLFQVFIQQYLFFSIFLLVTFLITVNVIHVILL